MSKVQFNQKGYVGSKMSIRASAAYESGEMPISKWTKSEICEQLTEMFGDAARDFKSFKKSDLMCILERSSWHHTGKFAQCTDFYRITLEGAQWFAWAHHVPSMQEAIHEFAERMDAKKRDREENERREAAELAERRAIVKQRGESLSEALPAALKASLSQIVTEEYFGELAEQFEIKTSTGYIIAVHARLNDEEGRLMLHKFHAAILSEDIPSTLLNLALMIEANAYKPPFDGCCWKNFNAHRIAA